MITQKDLLSIFTENKNIIHYGKKSSAEDLFPYMAYNVDQAIKDESLLFMEMGVFTGNTFNMIRMNLEDHIKLYGFDTFTGLPEDWKIDNDNTLYAKGTFALNYIPENTSNTEFIVGRVEDTLDNFLSSHSNNISFIHFDMDLYNPIYFSLIKCYSKMINGTILVFDDFYNLPGWENYSFKALLNFINEYNIKFEPVSTVGFKDVWGSASIKILK